MRVRLKFSKTNAMRFTGHLDLHRTIERTMRRANLPLAYSQGFNPRPKITLASALPLGYTSDFELVDFWLKEEIPLEEIEKAILGSVPPGIKPLELNEIETSIPKLQTQTLSSSFQVTIFDRIPNLEEIVKDTLSSEEIIIEKFRKGKIRRKNLRDFIFELKIVDSNEKDQQSLVMTLQAEEGKTGRPDDLLSKMGIDPLAVKINRTNIQLKNDIKI